MFLQKTLKGKAVVNGIGIHSGKESSLSFCPAPPNTGIHLIRSDLPGCPSVPVHVNNVKATSLATSLGCSEFVVGTVEHCLSTLAAFRIDNVYLELKGEELPIGDGSAKIFLEQIQKVGTVEQSEPRKYLHVTQPIYCGDETKHAYIIPYTGLRVSCSIDFQHPLIGQQFLDIDVNETTFSSELAGARTFGFLEDVQKMRSLGLSLGGSLENAVVFTDSGVMNPDGLRYQDECVRHKVLDAIGDMVTAGHPILGHVVLYKAGHQLMNELVSKILNSPGSFQFLEMGAGTPLTKTFEIPFAATRSLKGPFS